MDVYFQENRLPLTTLNSMNQKKAICLRKSEVSVDRISVRNIIEYLAEHGMHCLPYSYTNDVIDMLPLQPFIP